MTGEISLRGLVLPVGGIKEKVLAAKRAGLSRVLLPDLNQRDLEDIPPAALEGMRFEFLKTVDEALAHALEPSEDSSASPSSRSRARGEARRGHERQSRSSPPLVFSLSTTTARATAVGAGEINYPAKNSRLQQDAPSQEADGG